MAQSESVVQVMVSPGKIMHASPWEVSEIHPAITENTVMKHAPHTLYVKAITSQF